MSLDAATTVALMKAFDVRPDATGPRFSAGMEELVREQGLDLYREICCALGSEATREQHGASSLASGTGWSSEQLRKVFQALSGIPLAVAVLPQCDFLHFGTTRQLIGSGLELLRHDRQTSGPGACISLNNLLCGDGRIVGGDSWVEGCRINAPLKLGGQNVVVGVDIDEPLELPAGASLDVIAGQTRAGRETWFVRVYHVGDTFKDLLGHGATLAGRPFDRWLGPRIAFMEVWPAPSRLTTEACGTLGSFPPLLRRNIIAIGFGCLTPALPLRNKSRHF